MEKHTFGYLFMKTLKFNKKIDDVSTFEKIRNVDYFSGFCSPEFNCLVRDLAIFRLKCNEQYSSIPKNKKITSNVFVTE